MRITSLIRRSLPFCCALLAATVGACSSGNDPDKPHAGAMHAAAPASVTAALARHYPGATVVRDGAENEDGQQAWEAILHVPGAAGVRTLEVTLLLDGTVLSEEERITEAELPAAVATALTAAKGAHGTVEAIERSVTPNTRDKPTFEVLLTVDGKRHEMQFDATGRIVDDEILRASKHDDDDDEGDEEDDD